MTFLAESVINGPIDASGGGLPFARRVKTFQAGSAAALETAINNWLITLEQSATIYVVFGIVTSTPSNNNTLAVVSYGYFVPT